MRNLATSAYGQGAGDHAGVAAARRQSHIPPHKCRLATSASRPVRRPKLPLAEDDHVRFYERNLQPPPGARAISGPDFLPTSSTIFVDAGQQLCLIDREMTVYAACQKGHSSRSAARSRVRVASSGPRCYGLSRLHPDVSFSGCEATRKRRYGPTWKLHRADVRERSVRFGEEYGSR